MDLKRVRKAVQKRKHLDPKKSKEKVKGKEGKEGKKREQRKENKKVMAKKQSPEDAFYDNLTLGLVKTLENLPRVRNVIIDKRQPCEKSQIGNWEQRHSVYLPEDMKKFFLCTDGFVLNWSYEYAPDDIRRVGYIHIPHLTQITLLRENIEIPHTISTSEAAQTSTQAAAAAMAKDLWGNPLPILTPKTKIFELNNVNDVAKVCMIYESTSTNSPKFYLLELKSFKWQFLSESFSEYMRMAIVHLGLPFWELCFSSFGLPSWAEQLFLLLAPHLLEKHEPRRSRVVNPAPEHPYNQIDPSIFRIKPKVSIKPFSAVKHKSESKK